MSNGSFVVSADKKHIYLGREDCINCNPSNPGKRWGRITCPVCKGTGRGIRGGKGGCRRCSGFKSVFSPDNLIDCNCVAVHHTIGQVPMTMTSSVSLMDIPLPIHVVRQDRPATWNEAHLGFGSIWSSTSFWEAKNLTDEELIAAVKTSSSFMHVQVCKFARDTDNPQVGLMADHLAIVVHNDGYVFKAVFND